MLRTVEAVIDEKGNVRLVEPVTLTSARRALVTILEEAPASTGGPPPVRAQAPPVPAAHVPIPSPPVLTPPRAPVAAIAVAPPPPRQDLAGTITPDTIPPGVTRSDGWERHYQVLRQLGAGGMGRTFLAIDRLTKQPVCLKVLRASTDHRALAQECRALAKLHHEHIVRLINFDAEAGQPYLVVEYVPGLNLARYLKHHKLLGDAVVLHIARALCDAVHYAHGLEVLHCDLKPANILLAGEMPLRAQNNPHTENTIELKGLGSPLAKPLLKVVDFGLSVVDRRDDRSSVTGEGRVAGTAAYMAPEQFRGERLSGACDVYALGQVLWEMLAGKPAFSGPLASVVTEKMRHPNGLDASKLGRPIPEALVQLIRDCTLPTPARRPTAAAALDLLGTLSVAVEEPAVLAPFNLGFDLEARGILPPGWCNGVGFVAGVSANYEITLQPGPDEGQCARLRRPKAAPREFGSLMQRCPAAGLGGRDVKIEASVRTEGLDQWAGLWLRIDGPRGHLAFDNMHNRPIRGNTAWQWYAITMSVPLEATWFNYGVLLVGSGTVWMDDVSVSVRDGDAWVPLALWDATEIETLIAHETPTG